MAEKTVITTPKAPTKKKVKKGNAYVCEMSKAKAEFET